MNRRIAVVISLCVCGGACTDEIIGSNPRPASTRSVTPPQATPQAPAAQPHDVRRPGSQPATGFQPLTEAQVRAAHQQQAAQQAAAPAEKDEKRDYAAELIVRMAGAAGCVKPRPVGTAPEIRVALTAHVMPSGRVSRGSASSGALSADEAACVQARLEHSYLPGPIEDAPRTVSATLVLKLQPAPATP